MAEQRGLSKWSQRDLAKRVPEGIVTIHQLGAAVGEARRATLDVIRRAFESAELNSPTRAAVAGRAAQEAPAKVSPANRVATSSDGRELWSDVGLAKRSQFPTRGILPKRTQFSPDKR